MIHEAVIPRGVHEGAMGLRVHVPEDMSYASDVISALVPSLRSCHVGYVLDLSGPRFEDRLAVAQAVVIGVGRHASWALPIVTRPLCAPWPRFVCHLIVDASDLVQKDKTPAEVAREIGERGPRPRPEAIREIVLVDVEPDVVSLDTIAHTVSPGAWLTVYVREDRLDDVAAVARQCVHSWRVRLLDDKG